MTKYNTLNVKLSNSQINELKSVIINGTEVTLSLSSNMVGDSNGETNSLHKLLLTIHKFQGYIKLLKIVPQLIQKFQKLSCLTW